MAQRMVQQAGVAAVAGILCLGCSASIQPLRSSPAQIEYKTQAYDRLVSLPPPKAPVVVTVYHFRDQTGQYRPGRETTGWSTAVTQGATSMLIKALQDAGSGRWFTVVEREGLSDLLNERKIIRQTRKEYGGSGTERLPPLLFSPVLLNGGIIAYESDLLTGGAGARFLGIGASTQYRRDTVTIYLRLVSVKNGRVLKSVTTSKTIFSIEVTAGVFKFVDVDEILEIDTGFTSNEPPQMAVLEAIEMGVYSLVSEGALANLWAFEDPEAGEAVVTAYLKQKNTRMLAEVDAEGNVSVTGAPADSEPTPSVSSPPATLAPGRRPDARAPAPPAPRQPTPPAPGSGSAVERPERVDPEQWQDLPVTPWVGEIPG